MYDSDGDLKVISTPTKVTLTADDVISLSSESEFGTPQKPDVKRTRLSFRRYVGILTICKYLS